MSTKSKDSTPPPTVGKIGPYTVFVTPPPTPYASATGHLHQSPPEKVRPPPQQFHKPVAAPSDDSAFGFFWNAFAKVQRVHSSLDEYMAHWFGLNRSKYQWALDDYYENKEMDRLLLLPLVILEIEDNFSKLFAGHISQQIFDELGSSGFKDKRHVQKNSKRVRQEICRSPAEMGSASFDTVRGLLNGGCRNLTPVHVLGIWLLVLLPGNVVVAFNNLVEL